MAGTLIGRFDWRRTDNEDGHRDYFLKWLVQVDAVEEGPAVVAVTPGLPAIGSYWAFGSDSDPWALCWPDWKISPLQTQEADVYWVVEQHFTTKPMKRCQDAAIESPMAEPVRKSGSFVKFLKEVTKDRFGKATTSTSHELFRGPGVEFDNNRPTVKIGMNVLALPFTTFAAMVDVLNDAPLWGVNKRCIKLMNASWQQLLYGKCNYYYSVEYDFEIDINTFDRQVVDEGTKCLIGTSPGSGNAALNPDAIDPTTGKANKLNPKNFEVYKDVNGENARVLLDGSGRPLSDSDVPYVITIEKYTEANFLSLGIPSSL